MHLCVCVFHNRPVLTGIPNDPGKFNLAVHPWVDKMSTGDGYVHHYERNGEFCVTVGPVTRTAGILTQSVKDAGC